MQSMIIHVQNKNGKVQIHVFKFHKDIFKLHQLILKYPVHIKFVKVTKILYIQIIPYFFGMTAVNFGNFF